MHRESTVPGSHEAVTRIPLYLFGEYAASALVDANLAPDLLTRRWLLHESGYAYCKAGMMHRQIVGLEVGDPMQVDHINHDRLDNRRVNLRTVTRKENLQNRSSNRSKTSTPFRGVFYRRQSPTGTKVWRAKVGHNGRQIELGHHETPLQAALVIDEWRKRESPSTPPCPHLVSLGFAEYPQGDSYSDR